MAGTGAVAGQATTWIQKISQEIEKAFEFARPATQWAPAILLLCEMYKRPGLSAIALTAAVVSRLAEAGIDSGVNPDGSPNKTNAFIRIFAEEVVREIKNNCVIQFALEPGKIFFSGTGTAAGMPVVVTGTNTNIVEGGGIPH